ncbi:MAG TPA: YusG family protein [Bacillus sp. (in: firmicutes)]|nr:YusG family protein [Bacillus sp. (in: firmicutes)]
MFEKKKLDVTDRVTAKFHHEGMDLYVEKQPIGRAVIGETGYKYELEPGFEHEQYKFYQYVDVPSKIDEKYTDCDSEKGWC